MKEINPLAFRLGYKFFWNNTAQPKHFTIDFLLNIKITQFIHLIFNKKFLLLLLTYQLYKYQTKIILVFTIYTTNLYLQRMRKKNIIKRNKQKLKKKNLKIKIRKQLKLKYLPTLTTKFKKQYTPIKYLYYYYTLKKKYQKNKKRNKQKLKKNLKIKIRKRLRIKHTRLKFKYLPTRTTKFNYYKILVNKFLLENILFTIINSPNKIFFTTNTRLFLSHKRLLLANYKIYYSLFFMRKNKYFIDLINIIGFNLYFKTHNLNSLINLIINELHRTKRHYRFLNTIQKIILTFSKLNEKLCLFSNFKIIINGPINKHGRTKSFKFEVYGLNLQTLSYTITYNINYCITKFGTLSIRLWVS